MHFAHKKLEPKLIGPCFENSLGQIPPKQYSIRDTCLMICEITRKNAVSRIFFAWLSITSHNSTLIFLCLRAYTPPFRPCPSDETDQLVLTMHSTTNWFLPSSSVAPPPHPPRPGGGGWLKSTRLPAKKIIFFSLVVSEKKIKRDPFPDGGGGRRFYCNFFASNYGGGGRGSGGVPFFWAKLANRIFFKDYDPSFAFSTGFPRFSRFSSSPKIGLTRPENVGIHSPPVAKHWYHSSFIDRVWRHLEASTWIHTKHQQGQSFHSWFSIKWWNYWGSGGSEPRRNNRRPI